MHIETIQTTKATFPATPAIPPIEKRTRGGTPAATQNAPCQLSVRIISLGEFWPSERAKVGADPVLEGCGKSVIA
ncbi:hypothetical protein [Paracoccus cavernae]|uniref:hypothetical protein n=1 Tax=Paracoccus cavernae TaxID=1571207 RepID=UPI0036274123